MKLQSFWHKKKLAFSYFSYDNVDFIKSCSFSILEIKLDFSKGFRPHLHQRPTSQGSSWRFVDRF